MFNTLKLTIGIALLGGVLIAIWVFAHVLGTLLALVALYYLIKEYKEAENVQKNQ